MFCLRTTDEMRNAQHNRISGKNAAKAQQRNLYFHIFVTRARLFKIFIGKYIIDNILTLKTILYHFIESAKSAIRTFFFLF